MRALLVLAIVSSCQKHVDATDRAKSEPGSDAPPVSSARVVEREGFSVELPLGARLDQLDSLHDFELYQVVADNGSVLIKVYVGNSPDPRAPAVAEKIPNTSGNPRADCSTWDQGKSRECLLSPTRAGRTVHVFYEHLDASRVSVAERTMASVTLR